MDVLFYNGLNIFVLFCLLMAAYGLRSLEIYREINLDQIVEIYSNILDCKGLIKSLPAVSIGSCSLQCMSNYTSMFVTCKLSV
jgi:hypothetical protein